MLSSIRSLPLWWQFLLGPALVGLAACMCYSVGDVGHRSVALVLLMTVSVLAMLLRAGPVLLAAGLSALLWNFFFIPPLFTFHIDRMEDVLMVLVYFVVATVNALLSLRIRKAERRAREQEQQEKLIELYNTVLNSLSHELRTPITAIIGSVEALQQDAYVLSAEQRTDLLRDIDVAGSRLNRLVGDLLDMSRLENGMPLLKLDWCDGNELIGRVIARMEDPDRRIHFAPDPTLPLFKLDEGLLATALHNLLDNALRYTTTNVHIDATHSDGLVLTVSDQGPGIAKADQERLFQRFHRGRSVRPGGLGLGLSIAKGFVEAHGGELTLRSNTPSGAIFTMHLPAEESYISNLKHE